MSLKTKLFLCLTAGMLLVGTSAFLLKPLQTSPGTEHDLVKEAILDYVEGVYTMDTSRIYRSVHPSLVKRGSWFDRQKGEYVPLQEMTFQQLVNLTKHWNKDGKRANGESMRKIEVYDVQDKTATAKLTAVWGTDYFHLAKQDGKWYIMNVLWQSPKPH
ncbi:nuclear transport factor 2 family protein [Nafulsella turpanensis]|uniref:nuclear transport factor 2 family protein n=1 Tax=Nafulsella turpanensis TaxID=1265690 RepID=UPI000346B701|nr:nuclear transport factor 2 family protein [Nafulsella turpanensis]